MTRRQELPSPAGRRTLLAYAGLFAAAGGLCLWAPGLQRTVWLGAAGVLMALLAYLAFAVARDPGQRLGWEALVLSQGLLCVLLAASALAWRDPRLLAAAGLGAAVCLHLARLGSAALGSLDDPWRPRSGCGDPCRHESWTILLNDPRTRDGLWLSYVLRAGGSTVEGSVRYALFDQVRREVTSGRWEVASPVPVELGGERFVCRLGDSSLGRRDARSSRPEASWRLAWDARGAPPFGFAPELLYRLGLAGAVSVSPVSLGRFYGEFSSGGRLRAFADASGGVRHAWGSIAGHGWVRLRCALTDPESGRETVFELQSAGLRLGPFEGPRLARAHLWHRGRHHSAAGVVAGLRNRVWPVKGGWGFSVRFRGLAAEGECVAPAGLAAEHAFTDLDGRRLKARIVMTAALRLRLAGPSGKLSAALETEDAASIETVEAL